MAKQLLGKEVTDALNAKLIERANALKEKGVVPTLGIVRVGENPSDLSYEKGATKRAELIGINVQKFVLPEDASKEDLLKLIDEINANDAIHGVLMFRPLPKHLKADQNEICNRLDPKKDVDCMTDLSNAGVFEGRSDLGFAPCTPAACMEILDYYGIDCKGKNAVVIGRSLVQGAKPRPFSPSNTPALDRWVMQSTSFLGSRRLQISFWSAFRCLGRGRNISTPWMESSALT